MYGPKTLCVIQDFSGSWLRNHTCYIKFFYLIHAFKEFFSVNDWLLFVLLNSFCITYISLIVDIEITCVTYIFSSSYKQFFRLLFYKWIATFWHLHECILLNCNIPPHTNCVAQKLFVSFKTSLVVDFIITCVTFNFFFLAYRFC